MAKNIMARAAVTGMLLGAFTVGYFDGSVSQQRADAQGLGGILDRLPFSAARGIGEVNGEGGTGSQGQAPCHLKCRILSPEIPTYQSNAPQAGEGKGIASSLYYRRIRSRRGLTRYQSKDWSPRDAAITPGGKGNLKAISKPTRKNK